MKGRQYVDAGFLWQHVINKCKAINGAILLQTNPGAVEFTTLTERNISTEEIQKK